MRKIHHILKKGKTMTTPKQVIYFDCETTQEQIDVNEINQKFWFGCASYIDYTEQYRDEDIVFNEPLEFWEFVISKLQVKKKLFLFAHNTSFDFRVSQGFTCLSKLGFYVHKAFYDNCRFIMEWKNYPNNISDKTDEEKKEIYRNALSLVILDSMNYFQESLAKLGESIGVKKMDFPSYSMPLSHWITYCKNDVIVLQRSMEYLFDFIKSHELGTFAYTIAGQSLNAFKYRFNKHEITIHADKKVSEFEKESYYGGRTECFRIGKFDEEYYYYLDVNSMYPYVMKNNNYPSRFIAHVKLFNKENYRYDKNNFSLIAEVELDTHLPCFPKRINNRLCFPIGKFKAVLCQPELNLLSQYNIPHRIIQYCCYETEPIFQDYVNTFYDLRMQFRKEGNTVYDKFAKIFMNSLYGKFAQQNDVWENDGTDEIPVNGIEVFHDGEQNKTIKVKSIYGNRFVSEGKEFGFDSFVAISAYVTSYARVLLWNYIEIADRANCFYCDTDSLIVNQIGYDRLKDYIDSTQLGRLKLEDESSSLEIFGLKDYRFGEKVRIKGVRKNAKQLTHNQFLCEQWEGLAGSIMRNRPEEVHVKTIVKTLKREYHKGLIKPNGIVTPFELNEFNDRFQLRLF